MLLKFQEAFTVGHKALDAEHRRLLDTINDIEEAELIGASGRVANLLSALHFMAIMHFRHENAVISEIITGALSEEIAHGKFSEGMATQHRAEHARMLIDLETMVHAHGAGPGPMLAPRLKSWFIEHATGQDAELRLHLTQAGS
jgi:hemerythrin-like metal-binding protein